MKRTSDNNGFYITSVLAVSCCLLAAGCTRTTRSISNSGARPFTTHGNAGRSSDAAFDYRGELSEFDVLGIRRNQTASNEDIQRALERARPVKLGPGGSILLIQSGAPFPDAPMVDGLSRHFRVVPFSGLPASRAREETGTSESLDPEGYSRSLRLIGARGGCDWIVCYWGALEFGEEDLPTKTISWVPLVNWLVPDEKQHLRIRLRVGLVDIRTGNWSVFSPASFDRARLTISPRRESATERQIQRLKTQAYAAAVAGLLRDCSKAPL